MVQTLAHLRGEPHAAAAPRRLAAGEHTEIAVAPGITLDDPDELAKMRKLTHDGLLSWVGHRQRSAVHWHLVTGAVACVGWLDDYIAQIPEQQRLSGTALAEQYKAFVAEHGERSVIVIATCEAVPE
jgi:hypothetical protein